MPNSLIAILIRDHQEKLPRRMHNLARDIEQVIADGLGGGLMIVGWQNEVLEPGHQIEGQLSDEQIRPVGMEETGWQFLQAEAGFVFFDAVLHVGVLEMPLEHGGDG